MDHNHLSTDAMNRLLWVVFGGLQSTVLVLLIAAVFVTGYFLGDGGQLRLFQIGGVAAGVKSVIILYRWRLLPRC